MSAHRKSKILLQFQLNKSCPLPDEANKSAQNSNENGAIPSSNNAKFNGRRLRQRQEKKYYENARRNTSNNPSNSSINSVKSLQLSPHKANGGTEEQAEQLSALKSRVQSYFRAGQTFRVQARRLAPDAPPAYLIEWDSL